MHQSSSNELEFRAKERSIILKNEAEEIWENGARIAGYENIEGIAFKEVEYSNPKQYRFEIQLENKALIIAETLQEAQAKEFANRLFDFLEIE